MFENKVERRISGPKRYEAIEKHRRLHNEEFVSDLPLKLFSKQFLSNLYVAGKVRAEKQAGVHVNSLTFTSDLNENLNFSKIFRKTFQCQFS